MRVAALLLAGAALVATARSGSAEAPPAGAPRLPPAADVITIGDAPYRAKCDGSDETAVLQQALTDLAPTGGEIDLPAHATCGAQGLTWSGKGRLLLRGRGKSSVLAFVGSTGDLLDANGGSVDIQDMTVSAAVPGAVTSGYFVQFTNTVGHLRDVDFLNGYSVVRWSDGSDRGGAEGVSITNPTMNGFEVDVSPSPTGQQYGIIAFARISMQGTASNRGVALKLVSADTVTMSDSNLAGFTRGVEARTSASRSYLANLFFSHVLADGAGGPTATGDAWSFDGTDGLLARITIDGGWASGLGGNGFAFKNVKSIQLSNPYAINNGANGILLDTGVRNFSAVGGTVSANGGNGVAALAGSDALRFVAMRSGPTYANNGQVQVDTQRWGLLIADRSTTHYVVQDNDLTGNLTGGLGDFGGGTAGVTKVVAGNLVGRAVP